MCPLLVTLAVVAAKVMGGCSDARGGLIPSNVSNCGAHDSTTAVPLEGGNRIAPMDTLTIYVFGMPDLSNDHQVDLRGNSSIPLIREVSAIDKTPDQLDLPLTTKYSSTSFEQLNVSVGVRRTAGHNLTMDGPTGKFGTFMSLGQMSLFGSAA